MERLNQVRVKYGEDNGHLLPLRWDEEENHYFVRLSDVWEVYPKATGLIWHNSKEEHLPRKFKVFNKNRASEVWAVNIYAPNYSDDFWSKENLVLYVDTQLRLDDEIDFLMGVSFSGGGSRAAGFHLGAFQRLLEVGLLRFIDTFSAVSGGSLALGFVAVAWEDLCYCNFSPESLRFLVLEPLRRFLKYNFAVQTAISFRKKIWDRLVNKQSSSKYLSEQYEKAEREGKKLVKKMPEFIEWKKQNYPEYDFPSLEGRFSLPLSQALVDPEFRMPNEREGKTQYDADLYLWREKRANPKPLLQGLLKGFSAARINPLFVFCGTDVRTGLPFYFTQRTVGPLYDTKEVVLHNDDVPQSYSVPLAQAKDLATKIKLSQALAASSGFPIFFSPLEIPYKSAYNEDLIAYIADGAIYDNIGMDPFNGMQYYKKLPHMMIMVSDAGAPVPEVQKPSSSTIFSALRDNDLLNSQAVRLRKQILKKRVALEMMDGALWGLDDIWDYYYAIYYDLIKHEQSSNGDMLLKAKNSKPDVKSMTMSEVRQASDQSSEHFQSLAGFLREKTPGFPDLSSFYSLDKLKAIHDDLTKLTGFRTDLDCLSEDEIDVLEMAGYTLSAYSILRYCSERFSLLGVTQINPAKEFNVKRYEPIAQGMSKSLKYAGNHFVSFFLNNLFKK